MAVPSNSNHRDGVWAIDLLMRAFTSDEGRADPYPLYGELRYHCPSITVPGIGHVVSGFEAGRAVLSDPALGVADGSDLSFGLADPETMAVRAEIWERARAKPPSMMVLNPPDHTRQRALVAPAFSRRRIDRLRRDIAQVVEGFLDDLAALGTGDLMTVVADDLPVTIISRMLGVPADDVDLIKPMVSDIVVAFEPTASIESLVRAERASDGMAEYFEHLLAERRHQPADDLISELATAGADGDRLSDGEILAVAALLFAAGTDTASNLIGNGFNALFENPDQLDRLWADRSLVPGAVREMLRYDTPVQFDTRDCLEPTTVAGLRFEPGDKALVILAAANRDPEHFDRPDRFDITRDDRMSLAFAVGHHFCLGAHLAQAEVEELLYRMIDRFERPVAAGPRPLKPRLTMRGRAACPLTVRPRPG